MKNLKDVSLENINWIYAAIEKDLANGTIEDISGNEVRAFEIIVDTIAATPHENDEFYFPEYKNLIENCYIAVDEWEDWKRIQEEVKSWED